MRHDQFERELKMLLLLTENSSHTVEDICNSLDISRRTCYYYLESFHNWGFIVQKHGHYYSIDRKSPFFLRLFDLIDFSRKEVLAILLLLNQQTNHNVVTECIRQKLDRFYDIHLLANPDLSERVTRNVSVLYEAIQLRRIVKVVGYSSLHSNTVNDRFIEPFLLLNNDNEIQAFELQSGQNKIFKISRMTDVKMLDLLWTYEDQHKQLFTDIFMFSGKQRFHVMLRLGQLAHHLLLEEYPSSETFLTESGEGKWLLEIDVASYLGIGRFILGLYDDIEVLGDEGLLAYLADKIRNMRT